uniref:Uncharacterized protein n=1 Tax=Candidatus Kentrum sp. LFY TaxID=2126342 RepID=A0A450WC60_9GAMM|nr:MAG: hypothetical protein BECKLFY1418C_GA0070996_10104 [Candidatus Kentron sp. LFY]
MVPLFSLFECSEKSFCFWWNSERTRSLPSVEMTAFFFAMKFWFRLVWVGYRKNKDSGRSDARAKTYPLSILARSANMF